MMSWAIILDFLISLNQIKDKKMQTFIEAVIGSLLVWGLPLIVWIIVRGW
jgi:hypothetical protein